MNQRYGLIGVLNLLPVTAARNVENKEVAFVHYRDVTPLLDEVDHILGCVSERCSTSDEKNYTFTKDVATKNVVDVQECYGVKPLGSVMDTECLVKPNPAVHPFTGKFRVLIIHSILISLKHIEWKGQVGMR